MEWWRQGYTLHKSHRDYSLTISNQPNELVFDLYEEIGALGEH